MEKLANLVCWVDALPALPVSILGSRAISDIFPPLCCHCFGMLVFPFLAFPTINLSFGRKQADQSTPLCQKTYNTYYPLQLAVDSLARTYMCSINS